jgi:hypothetical protein
MNFPDWMIRVAMIKLALIAAGGLLVAGALVGRHARGQRSLGPRHDPPQLGDDAAGRLEQELGQGSAVPEDARPSPRRSNG